MMKPSYMSFRGPVEEAEYNIRWWQYQGSPGKVQQWQEILAKRIANVNDHTERFGVVVASWNPNACYAATNVVMDFHEGYEIGRLFLREHADLLVSALYESNKEV